MTWRAVSGRLLRWGRLARSFRTDLANGRRDGFPRCCRLRYALTEVFAPEREQALDRGVDTTRDGFPFVPCVVFHRARWTHAEWEQHINTGPPAPWY